MAGPSWLIDGNRFASKIKCASGSCDLGKLEWKSNPTRSCPSCHHIIDNSDIIQEWPGLPKGVKFDPTDQEIIQHLLAKSEVGDEKPHPFISEFIPTVDEEDGICYTHPCNLPGVKQDGGASHFFHRAIKAYNTGTRKRRKIHGGTVGDVRWHKTGRTKPVYVNGVQRGCKKIMVLYVSSAKGGKAEKTNWVMHQYHLGTEEDEKDGEYVISKVFHQQQPVKQSEKNGGGIPTDDDVVKADPVTPQLRRHEKRINPAEDLVSCIDSVAQDQDMRCADELRQPDVSKSSDDDSTALEATSNQALDHDNTACEAPTNQPLDHNNNEAGNEEHIWWDGESQYILNSQQIMEGLSVCDDFLQSQSPSRDGNVDAISKRSLLSEYAHLRPEDLKKDLEEYQNLDPVNINIETPPDVRSSQQLMEELTVCDDFLQSQSPNRVGDVDDRSKGDDLSEDLKKGLEDSQNLDPANIPIDTPPDVRLSQLEFCSQDSYLAWGASKVCD